MQYHGPKIRGYLVNKLLPVAGISGDNTRGRKIVRKVNSSDGTVKSSGQSFSQGHYPPTYQQARKGLFIL